MKAISLDTSTARVALVERDLPIPAAGAGEVLVRVHAAGVTPTELI